MTIRHRAALAAVCIEAATLIVARPAVATDIAQAPARGADHAATSGGSIEECVRRLAAQDGGWCRYENAEFNRIAFTRAEINAIDPYIWGIEGPRAVLWDWNGGAHDPVDGIVYVFGGGHSGYGGNEVYAFHYRTGTWERLTAPSAYNTECVVGRPGCLRKPKSGPPSTHTYRGFFLNAATRTIIANGNIEFAMQGEFFAPHEIWEFNPSRTETRGAIAPLQWRRNADLDPKGASTPLISSGPLPNGERLAVYPTRHGVWNPVTGQHRYVRNDSNQISWQGGALFDPVRNVAWHLGISWFMKAANTAPPGEAPVFSSFEKVGENPAFTGAQGGYEFGADGKIYQWAGGPEVTRYDPDADKWEVFAPPTGPSGSRVYTKWVFDAPTGAFVGVHWPDNGPWVFMPPAEGWGPLATVSAQSFVDAAPAGSTVTIPPGLYPGFLTISKPLRVIMDGVTLSSAGHGVVHVLNANGPVTIEGFTHLRHAGFETPGVRIQNSPDVTVRRFRIARTTMGIQSDNRPDQKMVLEDGLIEEIGDGSQLSHGIYFGIGDTLTVRRVTVRRGMALGHLLKTRAKRTVVDASRFLGLDGTDSREMEFTCGGEIKVTNSIVQKGANSDNAEMIAVAIEWGEDGRHCGPNNRQATRFEFTGNWLVFDRQGGSAGPNQFGKWRGGPNDTFAVKGNRIVNMPSWGEFPDLSASNTMYASREAAGLTEGQAP